MWARWILCLWETWWSIGTSIRPCTNSCELSSDSSLKNSRGGNSERKKWAMKHLFISCKELAAQRAQRVHHHPLKMFAWRCSPSLAHGTWIVRQAIFKKPWRALSAAST